MSSATAIQTDGWEGILSEGEEILWQGQPEPRIEWEFKSLFEPFFFLFFTGFSIFWMIMASQAGGVFWMFGLLFFGIGIYNLVGQHFWKALQRSRTFYTLTNKKAYIATNGPFAGKTLKTYVISAKNYVELKGGNPGSIVFAQEFKGGSNGKYRVDIGFEHIANPKEVLSFINQIQEAES